LDLRKLRKIIPKIADFWLATRLNSDNSEGKDGEKKLVFIRYSRIAIVLRKSFSVPVGVLVLTYGTLVSW
jgi:hypothetical protein